MASSANSRPEITTKHGIQKSLKFQSIYKLSIFTIFCSFTLAIKMTGKGQKTTPELICKVCDKGFWYHNILAYMNACHKKARDLGKAAAAKRAKGSTKKAKK